MIHLSRKEGNTVSWEQQESTSHSLTIHPSLASLYLLSSYLVSSLHPSPINPPFSSLPLLIQLIKTGISGISTLIFGRLHPHCLPLPGMCVTAQGLPSCCPHRHQCRSAMLEALRDRLACCCTVNIHSWVCYLSVNMHSYATYLHTDQWSFPELVVTFPHFLGCEWRNITLDMWFQFNSHPLDLFTPHRGEICYRLFSPCHSSCHWCHIKWTVCNSSLQILSTVGNTINTFWMEML